MSVLTLIKDYIENFLSSHLKEKAKDTVITRDVACAVVEEYFNDSTFTNYHADDAMIEWEQMSCNDFIEMMQVNYENNYVDMEHLADNRNAFEAKLLTVDMFALYYAYKVVGAYYDYDANGILNLDEI
jgi:hypothetical protein